MLLDGIRSLVIILILKIKFSIFKKNNSLFTWIPITDTWPGNGVIVLMPRSHKEKNISHNKNLFSDRYKVNSNKRGEHM